MFTQEGHSTRRDALVLDHCGLLGLASVVESAVALGVVHPGFAGADPPALDAFDRAVDVEDFEDHLETRAIELHQRFECRCRRSLFGVEVFDDAADQVLAGEATEAK